jgi:multicomponent Na+:H+ antiporter subunit G
MQVFIYVLLFTGVAVIALSAYAALVIRQLLARMHFLSPVTSLGAPLIGLALALQNGWGLTAGLIVLTVGLVAVSGPIVAVAAARVTAEREGIVVEEPPE